MSAFFSGTDWSNLNDRALESDYFMMLIVNFAGNYVAKVAFKAKRADNSKTVLEFANNADNHRAIEIDTKVAKEALVVMDCEIILEPVDDGIPDSFKERYQKVKVESSKPAYNYSGYGSARNRIYEIKGKMTHNPSLIKDHCRFQLFNKYLFSDLSNLGLSERKSLTVPNIIIKLPNEFKKSFILGYLDGDGSISYNKTSKQLVISFRGTQALLQGIANELNLSKYSLKLDKVKQIYTLCFWRKQDIKNFYNIYNNSEFFLERKYKVITSFLEINKDETISSS